MTVRVVRLIVFAVWIIAFLMDELLILMLMNKIPNSSSAGFESAEIRSWAWRVAYIFLPVLIAFASFWFTPDASTIKKSTSKITKPEISFEQVIVLFALTILVHGAFFSYLYYFIYLPISNLGIEGEINYSAQLEGGLNLFLFLLPLAIIPVGWLLRKPAYTVGLSS